MEAGQRSFLEFLENVTADLRVIEAEWEGVHNALQVSRGVQYICAKRLLCVIICCRVCTK